MKRLLVVLLGLLVPSISYAQIPAPPNISTFMTCGEIKGTNISWKSGNFGWFIEYAVSTSRSVSILCLMDLSVTAHIEGVGESGGSDTGGFNATARRSISVGEARTYHTIGNHGWIWYILPVAVWSTFGPTMSPATISAEETGGGGGDPDPDPEEPLEDGEDGTGCDSRYSDDCWWSPLIVDLAHDGFHLTSAADGVMFDIDGDGTLDRIAWTRADSDDAWLAMDRNGNGVIDNGTELFGNVTPGLPNGPTTQNGFEALKFLETLTYGPARPNGVIDSQDSPFARLVLWRDLNHDGISQANELTPVAGSGLQAIHTDYNEAKRRDAFGNLFKQRAKATFTDGDFFIYDVWLKRAR